MTPAEIRKQLGLSRREMTIAMGVHPGTWEKWERTERKPDRAAVKLMALLCLLHQHNINVNELEKKNEMRDM